MSARVYGLKHATGSMKIHHMNMVLDWRAALTENMANPPDRHLALEAIKAADRAGFDAWYDEVYRLRRAGRQAEYEAAIFKKFNELKGETK